MAVSPQDLAALALKNYQFARDKLAKDIADAENDDQADALRDNVAKLQLAYLKAQKMSFQAGNEAVEAAYRAATAATDQAALAYRQGKALADRIRAVSGAVTALASLVDKAAAAT
jgi:hypothetical protein